MVVKYITGKWQDQYATSVHAERYNKIEPVVANKLKYTSNSTAKEVSDTRLRLGKCFLNAYPFEIGNTQMVSSYTAKCLKP